MSTPPSPSAFAAAGAVGIRLRPIAYRVETRDSPDGEWRVVDQDAIYGRFADNVARSMAREYVEKHHRAARVSTWDLTNRLGRKPLPKLPSTRLSWVKSLEDDGIPPHFEITRLPQDRT